VDSLVVEVAGSKIVLMVMIPLGVEDGVADAGYIDSGEW
jgi:hypothetical protein